MRRREFEKPIPAFDNPSEPHPFQAVGAKRGTRKSPPAAEASQQSVLIIDDDPNAIELARFALEKAKIPNPVVSLMDGAAAIAHLQRCACGETPMPLFVFLDLKMPGLDGFDVLHWIRHEEALRRLIVVVLSTSTAEQDVTKAFAFGADAYLSKFPPVSEIQTIFQLANAMFSVEELEKVLWPGLPRPQPVR